MLGFAGQIPTFILSPLAGVLVDRWNRYRVLLATQTLAMIQSALLAALALGGFIRIWEIVALNVFQGLIDAFDMPVRQSMVASMVDDRADLPNAIALNSSMVNGARLLGPAIAGVLIAAVGEGWCFFVDALSYAAVIVSVLLMRLDGAPACRRRPRACSRRWLKGSATCAASHRSERFCCCSPCRASRGGRSSVLLPVIAREVMHGGAGTLGTLQATAGVGALAGALYLASRTSVLGLGRAVVMAAALFGLGLMAFSRAHVLWLADAAPAPGGHFGMMLQTAASNTIIQTVVDEDKRGRVMSLLAMSLFGTVPIGSLDRRCARDPHRRREHDPRRRGDLRRRGGALPSRAAGGAGYWQRLKAMPSTFGYIPPTAVHVEPVGHTPSAEQSREQTFELQ